jgi:hypothetical protein
MLEVFPDVSRVQQSFSGDAANQKACSAQSGLLLDEGGFQSILPGAHCRRVTAWTAADHRDVVRHFRLKSSILPLFFSAFAPELNILR